MYITALQTAWLRDHRPPYSSADRLTTYRV